MPRYWTIAVTFAVIASCSDDTEDPICGNGRLERGEACDGDDLGDATCAEAGEPTCTADCTLDLSACTSCGDGVINAGEACDGGDLGDATCASLGYGPGNLTCTTGCTLETRGCAYCGNGVRDGLELCDGGDHGGLSCESLGFTSGLLGCDSCLLDASACTGCTDDLAEPNDSLAEAAQATSPIQGVLCDTGDEEDWYDVDVVAGELLAIELWTPEPQANLDVQLVAADGSIVDSSHEVGRFERILVPIVANATLAVRIYGQQRLPGVSAYRLAIVSDPGCTSDADCDTGSVCDAWACASLVCDADSPCPGDLVCDTGGACVGCATPSDCGDPAVFDCTAGDCVFDCPADPWHPNGTPALAATLAVGATLSDATLCGAGSVEWFALTLLPMHRYQVDATFLHSAGDIDLTLVTEADPSTPLAGARSRNDDEHLSFAVPSDSAGAYLVRVDLYGTALWQSYDLTLVDSGAVGCVFHSDCTGIGEYCVADACAVPVCSEDGECTAPERCQAFTCVAQPTGDTCDAPIVVPSLPFDDNRTIDAHRHDVGFDGDTCTGWGTGGKDVVYAIELTAAEHLVAVVSAGFDASLYITDRCAAAPLSADACMAGVDEAYAGGLEQLTFIAPSTGTYFLVVDSLGPELPSGPLQLSMTSE